MRLLWIIVIIVIVFASAPVMGAQGTQGSKVIPGVTHPEYNNRVSVGLSAGYMWVPNFLLAAAFEKYQNISIAYYGAKTSIDYKTFDLTISLLNWSAFVSEGEWINKGAGENERYIIKANMSMVSLDATLLWKFRVAQPVAIVLGPGLGFGVTYGDLKEEQVPIVDKKGRIIPTSIEKKRVPPVFPLINIQTGLRFYPIEDAVIALDLGFKDGLYAGVGFEYFF